VLFDAVIIIPKGWREKGTGANPCTQEPVYRDCPNGRTPNVGDGICLENREMSSYTNLLYHIVFSTKDRHAWLNNEISPRLPEYLGGAIRAEGGVALVINGMFDHVHILAKLRQDKAVSDVVRSIKANSSGWIHHTFSNRHVFAWQNGYGAFTVSASQVEKVKQYIINQEKHHKEFDFKHEFIVLLKTHEVEFDEKYHWV
jgi:putative transposase